ncbi:MFS transporter [Ruminococcaceae bacterium OttesenSCG-928-A16]|nr:MFS transporter [Ruminococcaceae bacterium OttesenSCG-928-A16]
MYQRFRSSLQNNRKIVAFLTSQAISLFGSSLVQYAIMWNITLSTQSGVVLAIYSVCSFLPQIIVSLFAGVFADRYDRKKLIIIADGTIALSTLALIFLTMAGYTGLVPIYIVAAIRSLGSGVQNPAVNAILPQIVPEEKLMRVNSINGTIQSVVMLVAPAVAGAVLALGTLPQILMIDVVTAAIGIGILAVMHIAPNPQMQKSANEKLDVFGDLVTGVRYTFGNFFVRRLTLYSLAANLMVVPLALFNVLFVTRAYGDSYFYLTANEIAFFVGSIIGGIVLASWGGFKNRLLTLAFGCAVFGAMGIAIGFVPPFWVYLGFMVVIGLTMPTFQTPIMVLLQEKVPGTMLGRVFSLIQIVSISVMLIGSVVFGPLFDIISIQSVMKVTGLLMLVYTAVLLLDKQFLREGFAPAKTEETLPQLTETPTATEEN